MASSVRASGAPRQKCLLAPKVRCGPGLRVMSKVSGLGKNSGSRLAALTIKITVCPLLPSQNPTVQWLAPMHGIFAPQLVKQRAGIRQSIVTVAAIRVECLNATVVIADPSAIQPLNKWFELIACGSVPFRSKQTQHPGSSSPNGTYASSQRATEANAAALHFARTASRD